MNPLLATIAQQPLAVTSGMDIAAHVSEAYAFLRSPDAATTAAGFWDFEDTDISQYRPYRVVDGVLHVPVRGVLLNGFPFAYGSWATGYEYVTAAIERGVADADVHTIALLIDSGGGMVTGCFPCADVIYEARASKRVVAYVADHAYSAAYALASAAHEVVVTETGGVGSVGVLTFHIDASGAYEQWGIVKTYLFEGEFKVDGNETEPLTKTAQARIQRRLAASYDVFVGRVARNRGMSADAVRAAKALTYTALDGIAVGFADRIGTYDDAISGQTATTPEEDEDMAANQATYTQDQLDAAVKAARDEEIAAAATAVSQAGKDGRAEGTTAERTRIAAILGSDDAKQRPAAAHQAAFVLALDAATAATFLAGMPVEGKPAESAGGAAAPKGMFEQAMGDGKDGLAANVKGASEADPEQTRVDAVFALRG